MDKKKALCLASMASNLDNFNRNNVKLLQELDYDVTLAANFCTSEDSSSQKKIDSFRKEMKQEGVHTVQIDFSRKIAKFNKQIKSIKQVKRLLSNNYDLIHCHTPICAAITRLCARKYQKKGKTRVIYTAHGFHFFKGAPIKNWIFFYPVERWFSRYTDVLITINKEDYRRAKKYFKAKKTVYVPGVGVDTKKFKYCKVDKKKKRAELDVNENSFLLLSVGELSERKNHIVVIEALKMLKEEGNVNNTVYLIVGKGVLEEEFKKLIEQYNLGTNIKLLGYRTDIAELCKTVDCFVHPSIREGLGIAPLEAMASGLPLITSRVNGIKDYTKEGVSGCCVNPNSVNEMAFAIKHMRDDKVFRDICSKNNLSTIKGFDIKNTEKIMSKIYMER